MYCVASFKEQRKVSTGLSGGNSLNRCCVNSVGEGLIVADIHLYLKVLQVLSQLIR